MKNKQTSSLFNQRFNSDRWFGLNDSDCTIKSQEENSELYLNFCILSSENILFTRDTSFWGNWNQGLVITDMGIHIVDDNDEPENVIYISWQQFDRFSYIKKMLCISCLLDGEEEPILLPLNMFCKGISEVEDLTIASNSGCYIADLLQAMADTEPRPNIDYEKIWEEASYDFQGDNSLTLPSELFNSVQKIDTTEAQKDPELADFVAELRVIDALKTQISDRLGISIEAISKSGNKLFWDNMGEVTKRVNLRLTQTGKIRSDNKWENRLDLFQVGLAVFSKIASNAEAKRMERQTKLYEVKIDEIKRQWYLDVIHYITANLEQMTNSRQKLSKLYEKLLVLPVDYPVSDSSKKTLILATAIFIRTLYEEHHCLETIRYLYDLFENHEAKPVYTTYANIMLNELSSWPVRLGICKEDWERLINQGLGESKSIPLGVAVCIASNKNDAINNVVSILKKSNI